MDPGTAGDEQRERVLVSVAKTHILNAFVGRHTLAIADIPRDWNLPKSRVARALKALYAEGKIRAKGPHLGWETVIERVPETEIAPTAKRRARGAAASLPPQPAGFTTDEDQVIRALLERSSLVTWVLCERLGLTRGACAKALRSLHASGVIKVVGPRRGWSTRIELTHPDASGTPNNPRRAKDKGDRAGMPESTRITRWWT